MVEKLPFLPDEHHYAIAAVATRGSQMEHHIEHTIYTALLKQEHVCKFVLKNLSTDRIVGMLKAALLDHAPEHAAYIDKLESEIARLRTERNEIMHWIWGKSLDPTKAFHVSYRPYREQREKEKTAADIQRIADDMMLVTKALIWWSDRLALCLQESLRDTREPPSPQEHLASEEIARRQEQPPPLGHPPQPSLK